MCAIEYYITGESGGYVATKVFQKMHDAWKGTYENDATVYSWLKVATIRMSIDVNRGRKSRLKHLQKYTYEKYYNGEPTTKQEDYDRELLHDQQQEIIALCNEIDKLPADIRETFILHYIKGYPYRKIASILKVNKNTVTSRINNAKIILRLNFLFKNELS